jgi:hypothetical protein
MDRAVGVWSECIVTPLIPWDAQYPHQGTTFMENAFINEFTLLMAGVILHAVAWIFMHELWSVTISDVIVHEKEGCGGINVRLVYFYSFAYTFFCNGSLWM